MEICNNGIWGTVCDNFWGTADAQVACRQLGFPTIGMYKSYLVTNLVFYHNIITLRAHSVGHIYVGVYVRMCVDKSTLAADSPSEMLVEALSCIL